MPRSPWVGRVFNNSTALVYNTGASAIIRFGSNLILTRLLAPEAFGVVLVLTSVAYVITMLSETGIHAFIIRTPGATDERYLNVLWTISVLRGIGLAIIMFAAAPVIAPLVGHPELVAVLRVGALSFIAAGIASPAPILMRRDRRDYYNTAVEFGNYVVQVALTIGLAWWLRSYWGLVIAIVLGGFIGCASTYLFYRTPKLRLRFDREVAGELWRFSRFIAASSVLTIFITQFDKFFVVSSMSLATAGLYNMAWGLALVADSLTQNYSRRVFFPEVSHRLREGVPQAEAYYQPIRIIRPFILFACAAGVTFGPTFFEICFDPRYHEAGKYFAILAIRPILSAYSRNGEDMMLALNKARTKFTSDVLRLVWLPAAATAGYHLYEIWGLLGAVALTELPPAIYFTVLLQREGIFRIKREVLGILAIGVGLTTGYCLAELWGIVG